MFSRILNTIAGLLIGLSLASCGGGNGTQVAEGGIGGTGISWGSVTGFGSIIVNGVHFDTTGAEVVKDDDTPVTNFNDADINQLISIGMVVTVKGSINDDGVTGTAETISYEDILEGPVVGTPSGNIINVLGQTVRVVDGVTRYACDDSYANCSFSTFNDLADSQVIEVSGFIAENGDITAGYIELQSDNYDASDIFEVKGKATVAEPNIIIGGLTIINANTNGLDGQFIEAKGTFNGSDTLDATEVEIEDESFDIEDADKAELEGIASSGCTANTCDFTLAGVTVRVDSSTQFNTGSATDIDAGDKLGAKGTLQGGILHAAEIEFK